MIGTHCARIRREAEAQVRGELAAAECGRLERHAESCVACTTVLADARRAIELLEAVDLEPALADLDLDALRTRTMATIREEQAKAAAPAPWRSVWASLAAAAMVAAVVAVLPADRSEGPSFTTAGFAPPAEEVAVSTATSADGVVLTWKGEGRFRVLRTEGRQFDRAEVTVVCGTSWTDSRKGTRLVTYRVEREIEPCPGTAKG